MDGQNEIRIYEGKGIKVAVEKKPFPSLKRREKVRSSQFLTMCKKCASNCTKDVSKMINYKS